MHLQSIIIEKFRGFGCLKMDGFSAVNVLLGKNNSGKTSVLEAIFLLFAMSDPSMASRIQTFRGFDTAKLKNELKYLFYKFNCQDFPTIRGQVTESLERKLIIEPIFEGDTDAKIQKSHSISSERFLTGVKFDFKKGQEKPLDYKEDFKAIFLHTNARDAEVELVENLSKLVKDNQEHVINKLLNKFDGSLKSVYPLPEGIFIEKEGMEERVPLSIMGDGIRRFLNIAANLAVNKNQKIICLIDEIENGLHYTSQRVLWRGIFSLIRSTNIQLFITTHSEEMLESLEEVLTEEDLSGMHDKVKVFTIENTVKKGFQAYGRTFDGMKFALDNGIEIR